MANHGNRNMRRVRQNELDLIHRLTCPPKAHSIGPAVASVAQSMDEDDGGSMATCGGNDQRSDPAN